MDRASRPTRLALLVGAALVWLPVSAGAVTITGAAVDQAVSAALGSGPGGGACNPPNGCSDAESQTGPGPTTVPGWVGVYAEVSNPGGSAGDYTTAFTGSVVVEDITAGAVLGSFDAAVSGSASLDLTGRDGHDIRVSMAADIAMFGPEGFAGGATFLGQRSFSSFQITTVVLSQVVIPEPTSGGLLLVGLGVLAATRRRRGPHAAVRSH